MRNNFMLESAPLGAKYLALVWDPVDKDETIDGELAERWLAIDGIRHCRENRLYNCYLRVEYPGGYGSTGQQLRFCDNEAQYWKWVEEFEGPLVAVPDNSLDDLPF